MAGNFEQLQAEVVRQEVEGFFEGGLVVGDLGGVVVGSRVTALLLHAASHDRQDPLGEVLGRDVAWLILRCGCEWSDGARLVELIDQGDRCICVLLFR